MAQTILLLSTNDLGKLLLGEEIPVPVIDSSGLQVVLRFDSVISLGKVVVDSVSKQEFREQQRGEPGVHND